jgi:hypothetical protein
MFVKLSPWQGQVCRASESTEETKQPDQGLMEVESVPVKWQQTKLANVSLPAEKEFKQQSEDSENWRSENDSPPTHELFWSPTWKETIECLYIDPKYSKTYSAPKDLLISDLLQIMKNILQGNGIISIAAPMFQPLAIHNQSICINLVWTCSINPHKPKLHWQQSGHKGIATLATKLSAKGQNNAQFVKLLVQLTAAARLPTLLIFDSLPLSLDFWNLYQGHDSIFGSRTSNSKAKT